MVVGRCLVLCAALTLVAVSPVFAQQRGSISGKVIDQGGLALPGATVTISYTGTLVSSPTLTGTYTAVAGASGGSYTIPAGATTAFYKAQQ